MTDHSDGGENAKIVVHESVVVVVTRAAQRNPQQVTPPPQRFTARLTALLRRLFRHADHS